MSLIRKHGAVLQAWACLALVIMLFKFCLALFRHYLVATDISDLQIVVNCRFRGSECMST